MSRSCSLVAALVLSFPSVFLFVGPAFARNSIVVHQLETSVECSSYSRWWGLWVVKSCRSHFPTMREGIESALVESEIFDVHDQFAGSEKGADYDVYGTVIGLGTELKRTGGDGYCIGGAEVRAAIDVRIVERSTGKIVFGGNVQKRVDQTSHINIGENADCSAKSNPAFYEVIQRELSLAVARVVAFRIRPLTVTAVDGRRIALDRGKPLLSLGTIVKVADLNGIPQRYRVTGTMGNRAFAEPMGRSADVAVGAFAEYVESDDDEANARRFDKVDLP